MLGAAVADQDRGADFLAAADEGVVVPGAVGLDPVPFVGLGRPAAAGDPVEARGEVLAQPQQEGFRGADAVPGEGIDGVLLGVRGHHMAVVAFEVGRREVPAQLRGDVQVFDLMAVGVPGDLDDPDFGFSVLVVAEDDLVAHGLIPNFRYVAPKSHIEIKSLVSRAFLVPSAHKKEPTSVDASSLRPCLLLPGYVAWRHELGLSVARSRPWCTSLFRKNRMGPGWPGGRRWREDPEIEISHNETGLPQIGRAARTSRCYSRSCQRRAARTPGSYLPGATFKAHAEDWSPSHPALAFPSRCTGFRR